MDNLRNLSFADRAVLDELFLQTPSMSSERCFSTNFIWKANGDFRIAHWRGKEVIYQLVEKVLVYPFGSDTSPKELVELIGEFEALGFPVSIVYDVPPDYPKKFPDVYDYFKVDANPDFFDYVYDLEKLSNLNGSLLRKKRNLINQFQKANPDWKVERVSDENFAEFRTFMEKFAVVYERTVMAQALDNFKALNLGGLILRGQGGAIAAGAIFGKITPEIYSVHFEKSNKIFKGAAQMIVKLEADEFLKLGAKFMNREQDMGFANLRRAKKSLDPIMFERLILTKKAK